jgi:hypothetical protein
MFATRAICVHLILFVVSITAFVVLDLAQGVDSESTFLRLDWAHIIALVWSLIFATHAIMTCSVARSMIWMMRLCVEVVPG